MIMNIIKLGIITIFLSQPLYNILYYLDLNQPLRSDSNMKQI